jgi:hypothetical protein
MSVRRYCIVVVAMLLGCVNAGTSTSTTTSAACDVDGVTVESGRTLPDRDCFVCDPAVTSVDLTMLPIGRSCDDGRATTTGDACDGQGRCVGTATPATTCNIAGTGYAPGESPTDTPCVVCDPSIRPTAWTMRKSDSACDDGKAETTGDKCDGAGRCIGVAVIDLGLAGEACSDTAPCDEDMICHESICRETCAPPPSGYVYCTEDVFCVDLGDGLGVCVP